MGQSSPFWSDLSMTRKKWIRPGCPSNKNKPTITTRPVLDGLTHWVGLARQTKMNQQSQPVPLYFNF